VEYVKTVYYGGGRPPTKRFSWTSWKWIGLVIGIVMLVVAPDQTLRFLVLIGIGWVVWRAAKKMGLPL
jgi:hypothetical protein